MVNNSCGCSRGPVAEALPCSLQPPPEVGLAMRALSGDLPLQAVAHREAEDQRVSVILAVETGILTGSDVSALPESVS